MLTCIARSKQPDEADESVTNRINGGSTPANKQAIKTLTSQIKDIALKASGSAYRSCNPCTGAAIMMTPQQQLQKSNDMQPDLSTSVSERFRWSYRRNGSKNSSSGRVWGKELEARLKGISVGSGGGGDVSVGTLSASASGRRPDPIVLEEENEPKEWIAQVEPGVLITFVSLPRGGNDLKRIRFSREMFNKWQAQKWWQENYDKVMELYNVQRLNREAFPLPTPPRSEDESSLKFECTGFGGDSPITPPLSRERLPRTLYRPPGTMAGAYSSSSDSLDHQSLTMVRSTRDSSGLTATPKLSSISGAKTETSSIRTSEADRSGELSISNVSDLENEWVEQDEPGVYITIKALPGGSRELRRVRFSREKFGEVHARLWWEENRARIHKQYL